MKRKLILTTILASIVTICNGQQQVASLQITSDIPATVEIRGAIDGALQTTYPIDTFDVSPKKTIIYKADVQDYTCLRINLNTNRCFLWVFPGDSIAIGLVNGKLTFNGSNAPGHRYYHSHWNGTMWFVSSLQNMLRTTDDYSDLGEKFIEKFINPAYKEIDQFIPTDSVTPKFREIFKREVIDYQYSELWTALEQLHYNKTLTDKQKDQIDKAISNIHERFSGYDDYISMRYFLGSAYISSKYRYLFNQLSKEKQTELYGNHPPTTFGPYTYLLLAPVNVQVAEFFSAIMADRIMGFTSMDASLLIDYMRSIAPESESVAILTRLTKQQQGGEKKEPIQYINTEINSLAEIAEIKGIKGNYCLIDIWASWCIPCRQQFQYANQLHVLTARYNNLQLLYISIDEASAEKEWKEVVEKFNLAGFHLLANQKLQEDMRAKIFQQKSFTIPRYLLLSPSGEIICPDMPRPEDLKKVEQMLNQYLNAQ